ncbi:MAG: helix-turn-helix transcriptional regulator [Acidobacteria bacterium]|nr:helix-turn-helix transcriptional regulator [Acidobacteriota bacterium]
MGRLKRTDETERLSTPELAFGFVVRAIRRKQGKSQQWLADKSGYHRTYIGLLENGQKSPSLRTIFNISATLSVKPSKVLLQIERALDRARTVKKG